MPHPGAAFVPTASRKTTRPKARWNERCAIGHEQFTKRRLGDHCQREGADPASRGRHRGPSAETDTEAAGSQPIRQAEADTEGRQQKPIPKRTAASIAISGCPRDSLQYKNRVVRLPNCDLATVADAKIRDYLLSPSHPVGRFKSSFFNALGYSVADWDALRRALLDLARSAEAKPGQRSLFGQKFEIRGILKGPSGRQASIVSVWMLPNGRDVAHFVTAFPE